MMKRSSDMAAKKQSFEKEPMSQKVGQPYGSAPAKGICPEGMANFMGQEPMLTEYKHEPDKEGPCMNPYGIGEGMGGAWGPPDAKEGSI